MPHARLERFDNGKELELEDPNFNIDFIYVLRGGLQIDLELEQLQQQLPKQPPGDRDEPPRHHPAMDRAALSHSDLQISRAEQGRGDGFARQDRQSEPRCGHSPV